MQVNAMHSTSAKQMKDTEFRKPSILKEGMLANLPFEGDSIFLFFPNFLLLYWSGTNLPSNTMWDIKKKNLLCWVLVAACRFFMAALRIF